MQDFDTVISKRRSIRKYRNQPIPREMVKRLVKAGTWAPSAHDTQPWRFVILETPVAKRNLAEAMAAVYQHDLQQDGATAEEVKTIVALSVTRFTSAPLLLLVCLTMEDMDDYPDEKRQRVEQMLGVQSAAAAIQNILLTAHVEGLGACWCCAPLFCPEPVKAALELPSSYEPQALITLGYPAETGAPSERRPYSEILHYK
jgi:F420 biosynthesis protein FbiB-like protein